MNPNVSLGYVGVEVSDPSAFEDYLGSILGLTPGAATSEGATTWRLDDKAHRIIVHRGDADDIVYAGFVSPDQASFEQQISRLKAGGADVVAGTDEERAARRVSGLARTIAPWGTPFEFAWGLADADTPFESPLVPGGFLTGDMGVGHVVFMIAGEQADFDAAQRFVVDVVGMVLSDIMDTEAMGMRVVGNFYHCNGRHHSLALIHLPVPSWPKKLDHIMIETVSEDNVGHAYDRAVAAEVPIARHLGKHPNDRMFSFYSVTPAGFQMEFGAGAVLVDDQWEVVTYDRVSAWGHHSS